MSSSNKAGGVSKVNNETALNQEKSRADVMAERQAKKQAKVTKKKNVDNSAEVSSNSVNSKPVTNSKTGSVQNKVNENAVDSKILKTDIGDISSKTSINKTIEKKVEDKVARSCDVVDGEMIMRPSLPVASLTDKSKTDKSREDVVAQREAKKIAKLAKKQQTNVKEPVAVEAKTTDVKSETKLVESKQKCDTGKVTKVEDVIKSSVTVGDKGKENRPEEKTEAAAEKSKAELRAERRAKQEAQRAAKEAQKKTVIQTPALEKTEKAVPPKKTPESKKETHKEEEKVSVIKSQQHKLFSHLYVDSQIIPSSEVHPAIVELGRKYETRVISGSNARCVALLQTLKQVIGDYRVGGTSELSRGMEGVLVRCGTYLSRCRPPSVSMTNCLRHLRSHLTQPSLLACPPDEAKRRLLEAIDTFLRDQIDVAAQAISNTVQHKIANGDVIMTYGCSSLVWRCLMESYQAGKEFSVVVVDGGPWYEGRELLRRLAQLSIPSTYLLISSIAVAIKKISKVLLGAHALLANGYVMSRTGSAMVAMMASAHSVPVLVCCETYKFCERVQADAYVYNELSGSEEVIPKGVKWLSPVYDITPPDLVTAVVTELAILPCTSVPVVLRVKPSDIHHTT